MTGLTEKNAAWVAEQTQLGYRVWLAAFSDEAFEEMRAAAIAAGAVPELLTQAAPPTTVRPKPVGIVLDESENATQAWAKLLEWVPNVPDVLPIVRELYARHSSGCCWHTVLDDGNVKDINVRYCVENHNPEHAECHELAKLLPKMSRTQRLKLGKLATSKETP